MKILILVIAVLLISSVSFAAEQAQQEDTPVYTNSDLKKRGYSSSSNNDGSSDKMIGATAGPPVRKQSTDAVSRDKQSQKTQAGKSDRELEALLRQKWEGMKAALKRKDIEGALVYFVEEYKPKYRQVFEAIKDKLPEVMDQYEEFHIDEIYGNGALYRLTSRENGKLYSYPGKMVKDYDGIWKFLNF